MFQLLKYVHALYFAIIGTLQNIIYTIRLYYNSLYENNVKKFHLQNFIKIMLKKFC
jgi:hypothetical protein